MSHFNHLSQQQHLHPYNNYLEKQQFYYHQPLNSLQQQLQQKRLKYISLHQKHLNNNISTNNSDENLLSYVCEDPPSVAVLAASTSSNIQRKLPVVKNLFKSNHLIPPNTSPKIGNYTYFQPPCNNYNLDYNYKSESYAPILQQNNNFFVSPSSSACSHTESNMYSDRISFLY